MKCLISPHGSSPTSLRIQNQAISGGSYVGAGREEPHDIYDPVSVMSTMDSAPDSISQDSLQPTNMAATNYTSFRVIGLLIMHTCLQSHPALYKGLTNTHSVMLIFSFG